MPWTRGTHSGRAQEPPPAHPLCCRQNAMLSSARHGERTLGPMCNVCHAFRPSLYVGARLDVD
eukprot:4228096-Pyramimonas_sp.AAC.1